MATFLRFFLAQTIFLSCFIINYGERLSIKIVDEPSNYGLMNNYQVGNGGQSQEQKLAMRIKPANFSGPELFRRLYGKCFSKTDESYKYEFCPFFNVTQHEQSLRWNPYSGVLGVWQEWEIVNNTFTAMMLREGDKCSQSHRTARVTFKCGSENKVLNVSEPSTCNYHVLFQTPYTCHETAMLVYPTLFSTLQSEWGLLEGELERQEITEKGYNKYLAEVFVKAGYYLSDSVKHQISREAIDKELEKEKEKEGDFDTLYQCKEEYQKLKKENEGLRALLAIHNEDNGQDNHAAQEAQADMHLTDL